MHRTAYRGRDAPPALQRDACWLIHHVNTRIRCRRPLRLHSRGSRSRTAVGARWAAGRVPDAPREVSCKSSQPKNCHVMRSPRTQEGGGRRKTWATHQRRRARRKGPQGPAVWVERAIDVLNPRGPELASTACVRPVRRERVRRCARAPPRGAARRGASTFPTSLDVHGVVRRTRTRMKQGRPAPLLLAPSTREEPAAARPAGKEEWAIDVSHLTEGHVDARARHGEHEPRVRQLLAAGQSASARQCAACHVEAGRRRWKNAWTTDIVARPFSIPAGPPEISTLKPTTPAVAAVTGDWSTVSSRGAP